MPLESATYVDDLVSTNPLGTDDASLGDDHIRLIKSVLKNTFPNLDGALTTKLAALNGISQLITVGSDGTTLTFTFPSGGTVGNVTDWTSNQPVPASQADGRYVASTAGGGDDGNVQQLTFNTATKQITAQTRDGTWHFVQPAGDYATNSDLNTETTNRTNADTNLQNQINNRVQKTGDTMSWLEVDGGNVILKNEPGTTTAGQFNYSQSVQCETDGRAAAAFFVQEKVGGTIAAVIRVGWLGDGDWLAYYWFDKSGKLGSSAGEFALTSDLPFVDKNLRVQVFNATASNGDFVTIPHAFSTLVGVTAQQHSSGGEGIRPIRIETNVFRGNGFNVSIWSEGGGIQYTFVAYGYF